MRQADTALGQNGQGGEANGDCRSCEARLCDLLRARGAPRRRLLGRGERLSALTCLKLWTVLDGVVAFCSTLADGRRQVVYLSVAGDVVVPPLGVDGTEVWIEALAPTSLCELDLGSRTDSPLGQDAALWAELFRNAHEQAKAFSVHLVTLGRLDGMERVCLFLAEMAWRIGCKTAAGWRVRLPLSREDIADYLGLNPETVSRIFSRVKKAKLVTFLSPTDYLVPDIQALQRRAPLSPPNAPAKEQRRDIAAWELRAL